MREASAFWAKMSVKKELAGETDVLDWLSTHPADDSRRESIDQRIPELERVRALCQVRGTGATLCYQRPVNLGKGCWYGVQRCWTRW